MASLVKALKGCEDSGHELELQFLDNCTKRVKQRVKSNKHQEITFVTENDFLNSNEKIGWVVWFDCEEFVRQVNK